MRRRSEPDSVNLTPMIDIVFQMIIFFVFTLDLEREKFSEDITIAYARQSPEIKEPETGTMYPQITKSGHIKIGSLIQSPAEFRQLVRRVVARRGQHVPVMIYADGGALHRHVKRVMDICSSEGLYRLHVVGMIEKKTKN